MEIYREIAIRNLNANNDRTGVQAARLRLLDEALKK
jgi:hypothetical protein